MKNLVLVALFSLILTSCKYSNDLAKVKNLKNTKESLMASGEFELTDENQKLLVEYFGSTKKLLFKIQNNSKMRKYIHKKFSRYFDSSICKESLISKSFYDEIIDECTVNSFFICADDVAYFEEMLKNLYQNLTDSEKKKLSSEQTCKELIEGYKLN